MDSISKYLLGNYKGKSFARFCNATVPTVILKSRKYSACTCFIAVLTECISHLVQVIKGEEVVRAIEANGSVRGCPTETVLIWTCGQMPLNTNKLPTRPNWVSGKIMAEAPDWARPDLPQPTQYLPSIWRWRNNSVPLTLRRNIKDLKLCIQRTEDLRLEIYPRKPIYKERKRRPINANQTHRVCIINPFSMERNLTYRWSISPFAQADKDKELGEYAGTTEVPDMKTMRRISQMLMGRGSKGGDILSQDAPRKKPSVK